MTAVVSQLKGYGADMACCDASRVVRLTETINSKTGRTAQAWKNKAKYEFKALKEAINEEYRRLRNEFELLPLKPKTKNYQLPKKRNEQGGKVARLLTFHSLAYARMQDLKTIGKLRGGKYAEHRRRVIWCYAVEAANFCRDEHSLRAEVEKFIRQYIQEPEHYLNTVHYESTVKRFLNHLDMKLAGVTDRKKIREALGANGDKYLLTHKYIIDKLEITPEEQRKLKAIIGSDEKRRRNTGVTNVHRWLKGAK